MSNIENSDDLITRFEDDTPQGNKTFRIDTSKNILRGKIDGLDALRQSIYLMLSTEADQYIIYPYTYGIKTLDLIGKSRDYIMGVLPSRIKTTLLRDDRITDVTDFEFEVNRHKLNVKFIIHTIYGENIYDGTTTVGNYVSSLSPVEISLGEVELRLNSIIAIQTSLINGEYVPE